MLKFERFLLFAIVAICLSTGLTSCKKNSDPEPEPIIPTIENQLKCVMMFGDTIVATEFGFTTVSGDPYIAAKDGPYQIELSFTDTISVGLHKLIQMTENYAICYLGPGWGGSWGGHHYSKSGDLLITYHDMEHNIIKGHFQFYGEANFWPHTNLEIIDGYFELQYK